MSKQGWTYKKLGDYVIEYSVKNKTKEDIPVYSVTNSQGFCKEYFSKEVASQDKSTYKIVPFGFFAYNPSRINVGSIDWQRVEEKVIVSPLYNVFGVSENLLQSYLLYFLKSPITLDYINKIATGTVRLNLKFSMLKEFSLPVPPVAEQERIVEELDLLSGIIEKKKEQLKAYDQLAQSIFYTMFGDPITNEKGWETMKLGEVCTFTQGLQVPIEEQRLDKGEGDTRFLRIIDFTQGKDEPRYVKCFNERYILHEREIAIVRYGTPGFVCHGKIGVIANNLFKITPNQKDMFYFDFLVYWLNSDAFQSSVKDRQYGAALQAIKFSTIQNLLIIVPPLALQQEFAAKVEAIEQQKALIQQSIAEVQTLFDSRMDYWFG